MGNGRVDAAKPQFNRRVSRRRVHHRVGHQDRIHRRGTCGKQGIGKLHGNIRCSKRRSQKDANTVAVALVNGYSRVRERLPRRCGRHKRRAVHPPQIFDGDKIARREVADFRGEMRRQGLRIKRLQGVHGAIARKKPPVKFVFAHTQRGNHPQAGYDNALVRRLIALSTHGPHPALHICRK